MTREHSTNVNKWLEHAPHWPCPSRLSIQQKTPRISLHSIAFISEHLSHSSDQQRLRHCSSPSAVFTIVIPAQRYVFSFSKFRRSHWRSFSEFLAILPTSHFSASDSAPAALETYRYFRLPVRIVGPESEKLRVRKILTRKQK